MGLFNNLFKKRNKKSTKEILNELSLGDFIELTFKHPSDIGIIESQGLTLTRLNSEEASIKKVKGVVSLLRKEPRPLKSTILEVTTYNSPAMPGKMRKISFLEDEIEKIRIIT